MARIATNDRKMMAQEFGKGDGHGGYGHGDDRHAPARWFTALAIIPALLAAPVQAGCAGLQVLPA